MRVRFPPCPLFRGNESVPLFYNKFGIIHLYSLNPIIVFLISIRLYRSTLWWVITHEVTQNLHWFCTALVGSESGSYLYYSKFGGLPSSGLRYLGLSKISLRRSSSYSSYFESSLISTVTRADNAMGADSL